MFKTAEEFKNTIISDENEVLSNGFHDLLLLKDVVGFELLKEYPSNYKYEPPITRDGKPDIVARIEVLVVEDECNKCLLLIKIRPFSKFFSAHQEYDFDDPNCPTEQSVSNVSNKKMPLEIAFDEDFFYEVDRKRIVNKKNKEMSGIDVLNYVYKKHLDTLYILKKPYLHFKILLKRTMIILLDVIIKILHFLITKVFGRPIETKKIYYFWDGYEKEDLKESGERSLGIFEYKASTNTIIISCSIIFSGYIIFYFFNFKPTFIKIIVNNNLLSIVATILLLFIVDFILPNALFKMLNGFIKLKRYFEFKNIFI